MNRPKSETGLPTIRIGEKYITAFEPETALRVCEEIAEGKLLKDVLDLPGYPTHSTWYRWCVLYPDLKNAYDEARRISAGGLEEDMLALAKELAKKDTDRGQSTVEMDRLKTALGQMRWSAARRDPSSFGEKSTQSTIVPIQINTSLAFNGEGKGQQSAYHLEAKIIQPTLPPEEEEEETTEDEGLQPASLWTKEPRKRVRHKDKRGIATTQRNYARRKNRHGTA